MIETEWVVPTTVCAELLVGVYRGQSRAQVERFLEEGVDVIEPISYPIAKVAARIRADHPRVGLVDALVLATSEVLRADLVLTADRAWARVSDRVRVV